MSDLSSIRNLRDLEHQRALLLLKIADEEKKVLQDVENIKADYKPVTDTVSGIRSGISRLKTILPFALPILRFLWRRRKR